MPKFLANLLELSSREPKTVERNVRSLIQELVDMKVEPEQFCDRLERLLNASPQPCLIGFLKKSLPLLRQSMVNNELVIEGIRPPSASVVFPAATPPQTTQIRGSLQMATSQMRVIAQPQVRPGQQIQRIMTTPMKIATAQVGGVNKPTTLAPIRTPQVRPGTTQIVRTSGGSTITLRPGQTLAKTQFTTDQCYPLHINFHLLLRPSRPFLCEHLLPKKGKRNRFLPLATWVMMT
uniref:TAFH domain-containing protein n=1 Tax=Rhodnius prolixus TaxID=13249 RepID=T1I5P6_RHOPR